MSTTMWNEESASTTDVAAPAIESTSEEPAEAPAVRRNDRIQTFGVAFYNLENLFDTQDDPNINDEDFLPNGKYEWDQKKYQSKLKNMSRVLADICPQATAKGASVIGVAEVENRAVVLDLLRQPSLRGRGYRVLHFDSPDRRGIDCALIYNPAEFVLQDSMYVQYESPAYDRMFTRGFLVGIGQMGNQQVAFIVCHWPSRGSESETRERAGSQVRKLCKQLLQQYEGLAIVVMGDLNDDPDNRSLTRSLHTVYSPSEAAGKADELYNPWRYTLREEGRGTLTYKGEWNLFDQIIVSGNLVDANLRQQQGKKDKTVKYGDKLTLTEHDIFRPDYIQETEAKYRGNPLRTHIGTRWMNGYSDHFPTFIYLTRKGKTKK